MWCQPIFIQRFVAQQNAGRKERLAGRERALPNPQRTHALEERLEAAYKRSAAFFKDQSVTLLRSEAFANGGVGRPDGAATLADQLQNGLTPHFRLSVASGEAVTY